MTTTYDQYYQTEDLFGKPYPELIAFFTAYQEKGQVLDLGCGQGRDAVPIAKLGYNVTGIDNSSVGIDQMNLLAKSQDLSLIGIVSDVYAFDEFEKYDFVLLDSMFHFAKKDKQKETDLVKRIVNSIKPGAVLVICIQDTGKKVDILNASLDSEITLARLEDKKFKYVYEDVESGHKSESDYRMIVVRK